MPTVPSEQEDDMTSLASQQVGPKIKKLGWGDMSFPIGQVGTYGRAKEFRSLRAEVLRQTAEAQQPFGKIGELIGSKLGPGWDRMIKTGPKSKNIQTQTESLDPTETERQFVQYDAAKAQKEWSKTGPAPTGPTQPSMKGIATQNMGLNEQEQNLYQHHLDNLDKGGVKDNKGGTSTLLAITAGFGSKTYVIPTVWDNQIVSQDQAIANAKKKGLDTFPSYDDRNEATSRYMEMHKYMDTDVK
jgi:hypothetical protein